MVRWIVLATSYRLPLIQVTKRGEQYPSVHTPGRSLGEVTHVALLEAEEPVGTDRYCSPGYENQTHWTPLVC
jgi:hypothetical protein